MTLNRRLFAATALVPLLADAQSFAEGQHYTRLKTAQPPREAGRIEVLEFFSYACPACNAFDPALEAWVKTLPAGVSFRRVPAPFLGNAANFQRCYYALESMGLLHSVHAKVFEAVHGPRQLRAANANELAALVSANGGDGKRFLALFNGFAMGANLARGKTTFEAYGVNGLPTLGIGGRFTTSPSQAGGYAQALALAGQLIERVRKGA